MVTSQRTFENRLSTRRGIQFGIGTIHKVIEPKFPHHPVANRCLVYLNCAFLHCCPFLYRRLQDYSNIPRKQKPFGNFVKNSLRIWQQKDVDELWEAIQAQVAPRSLLLARSQAREWECARKGLFHPKLGEAWSWRVRLRCASNQYTSIQPNRGLC